MPYLYKLILRNNFIEYFPNGIFQYQKDLGHLDISHNYLKDFKFVNLPKSLTLLNISNNQISICEFISNIEIIDLSYNNISTISIGKSVKTLYISNNDFEFLNKSMLENAVDLINLNISNNKITEIENDLFKKLINLVILDLSNNNLEKLPVGVFQNLTNLWELNLSNNSLFNLEFGTFSGLDNLAKLYLDYNRLNNVPEKSFYVLRNLKTLYLNNNCLNKLDISELIKEGPSIKTITLGNNKWPCKDLFDMLEKLSEMRIGFTNGTDVGVENVNGIGCTENDVFHFDKCTSLEPLRENPHNDFKTSQFYKYFDKDFKNSSFYHFFQMNFTDTPLSQYLQGIFTSTRFFKYFDQNWARAHFFKYYNDKNKERTNSVDKDNDDLSSETDSNEDYYVNGQNDEPKALPLFSNEGNNGFNQEFLAFTNRITICVIINVGMIMILLCFILFVFVCKNRRHI
ncbi:hypothetical protein RN001_006508 [Aquatica leii]|uniref:Uncharacterized protein n=1 Tax=Aquatica leii TaxID=1421715 RepID=A0AAN7Q1T7_9COLE|nr:hypothetical protein RN001_006508 [Aquatica leii]